MVDSCHSCSKTGETNCCKQAGAVVRFRPAQAAVHIAVCAVILTAIELEGWQIKKDKENLTRI